MESTVLHTGRWQWRDLFVPASNKIERGYSPSTAVVLSRRCPRLKTEWKIARGLVAAEGITIGDAFAFWVATNLDDSFVPKINRGKNGTNVEKRKSAERRGEEGDLEGPDDTQMWMHAAR